MKNTPNTDDVEKITIVLIVPILLRLCKKKKIDIANPPLLRRIIFGISVKLIFILMPNTTTMASSSKPPIRDFRTIFASGIVKIKCAKDIESIF
jgi:hypothetical protein